MKKMLTLFCIFTLVQPVAIGQQIRLAEGDRVKIKTTLPGLKKVTGTFDQLNASEIFIHNNVQDFMIPLGSVRRVFVSRGTKRNSLKGMLIGAASGGVLLGVASSIAFKPCDPREYCLFDDKTEIIISNTIAGVLIGGGAGFTVGTFIKTDRWMLVQNTRRAGLAWNHHSPVPGLMLQFSILNRNH
jgi:hypothetical protein